MLTYYVFFMFILVMLKISIKKKNKISVKELIMVSLMVSLFAGMRSENVGTDLLVYVKPTYEDFLNNSFDTVISRHASEKLFMIILYVFSIINLNFHGVLFFIQLIITVNVMWFIMKKNNEINCYVAVVAYLTIFLGTSFNLVRQSIAISIVYIAFIFAQEKKLKQFIMVVFIASLFHYSAIVSILYYFILNIKKEKWLILIEYVIFVGILIGILFFKEFVGTAINIGLLPEKYNDYITKYYKDDIGMSIKDIIINALMCFYIILGLLYNSSKINNQENNYSIFFLILGFVLLLLGMKIQYAGRIAFYYLFIMYVYLIPKVVKKYNTYGISVLAYLLLLCYFGIEYGMLEVGKIVPYEMF